MIHQSLVLASDEQHLTLARLSVLLRGPTLASHPLNHCYVSACPILVCVHAVCNPSLVSGCCFHNALCKAFTLIKSALIEFTTYWHWKLLRSFCSIDLQPAIKFLKHRVADARQIRVLPSACPQRASKFLTKVQLQGDWGYVTLHLHHPPLERESAWFPCAVAVSSETSAYGPYFRSGGKNQERNA